MFWDSRPKGFPLDSVEFTGGFGVGAGGLTSYGET